MRRITFATRILRTAMASVTLYAFTWALILFTTLERSWGYLTARCLSVPYWTFSLVPSMVVTGLNSILFDLLPEQRVPPPATTAYLVGHEVVAEIFAGLAVLTIGSVLYALVTALLARYRLRSVAAIALLGGWLTCCLLIVSASGVSIGGLQRMLVWPKAILQVFGIPVPFDAPLSEGYPYPIVVKLVALYTLCSAVVWLPVAGAGLLVFKQMQRHRMLRAERTAGVATGK
jgi:hypothetical protein